MIASELCDRIQEIYATAGDVNAWDFAELETVLAGLASYKTPVVQYAGHILGLHGKTGKKATLERIRHRIAERRATAIRGEVIAKAAKAQTEEVYGVEEVI